MAEALPRLVERVRVIHVTGDAGYDEAVAGRAALPPNLRARYRPERFLDDEMTLALAAADLVVGRAGSSTLAEVAAFGLPMVVVPYPHAAGHQRRNAEEMVRCGAARLVEDEDFDAEALLAAAAILEHPDEHAAMAAAARSLARPGAADAVAELVLAAAEKRAPAGRAADRGHFAGSGGVSRQAGAAAGDGVATVWAAAMPSDPAWAVLAAEMGGLAGVRARPGEPLAGHTTMRVGGPADLLVEVRETASLLELVRLARDRGIPYVVLGRGSDLVVSDAGVRGLVILSRAEGCRIEDGAAHRRTRACRWPGPRLWRSVPACRDWSSAWRFRGRSAGRSGPTPAPTAPT